MLWRLLKKDMMNRKGVNFILFLFITLSTIFLASSTNNIMVISSAVDYYMDYAHIPDVNILLNSEQDKTKIDQWLIQQKEQGNIKNYDYTNFLEISAKSIFTNQNGKKENIELSQHKGISLWLSTQNVDYCLVFDKNGKPIELNDGEVAMSLWMMNNANLHIGDKIIIENQQIKKELTIKETIKDAAFGNELMGSTRLVLNDNDFQDLESSEYKVGIYYIMTPHADNLMNQFNNQGFTGVIHALTKDTYKLLYSFDMIIAGLLILIGICLILIALLVLRFTLVFSIEEQYQEIGILKAIGLKNAFIKKLYLIKYFVIVFIGATLGILLSIPISQAMIKSVSVNMIMSNQQGYFIMNILCFIFVVTLVTSFCYFCTRRLNKVSAITAIRGGYTGESFHNQNKTHLSKFWFLPVSGYLGVNDIMSHIKRYIMLVITFCVSFILITIPLNTINTMRSTEMVKKFMLDPNSSVYLRRIEIEQDDVFHNTQDFITRMDNVKNEMRGKGYQVEMSAELIYFIRYTDQKTHQEESIMTLQMVGKEKEVGDYEEGKAPILENEIAFSKDIMKKNKWHIGDRVEVTIHGQKKNLIITGVYSDYMQLGKSARLNSQVNCNQEIMFDYWAIMLDMDMDCSQEETVKILQKDFPHYEWLTAQQIIDEQIGGIQDILDSMLMPMTLMLCAIIMLMTLLMEKLFMTREKSEIAMLKSIGFQYKTIRQWQVIRMIFVALISMIISIPLSFLSNRFMLKPLFAIMGADLTIQINPLEAYIIYPGILLIGIILATVFATFSIKNINIRTMNNLE